MLTYCGVLLLCAGCVKDELYVEPSKRALVLYVVAHNNIENYLRRNIEETIAAVTPDFPSDGRVVVYYDGRSQTTGRDTVVLFEMRRNYPYGGRLLKNYDQQNSVDPEVMQRVMGDIRSMVPSDRYGLVMSSHGLGWFHTDVEKVSDLYRMRRSGVSAEHRFVPMAGAEPTRWMGDDDGAHMSSGDLARGLSPIHFDFILLDACFMSSIEVLYDLRNSADYVIASPTEIMAQGFPYRHIVPMFFDGKSSLEDVCRTFVEYYDGGGSGTYRSASVALVKMSALDALAESVRAVFAAGTDEADAGAIQPLESLANHAFFDLRAYIRDVCRDATLYSAFEARLREVVVYESHTETIYSAYGGFFAAEDLCGISSYIPRATSPVNRARYYETAWAQYTRPNGE